MAKQEGKGLDQFSLQELSQIRQGLQNELKTLGQSSASFKYASDRFEEGRQAIRAAQEVRPQQLMLLPLSNALYLEGCLSDNPEERKYLIEYGTGFFVERPAKEAMEYCSRKVALIRQKAVKLGQVIAQKKETLRQIQTRMMILSQPQV